MDSTTALFYVFSAVLLFAAFMVITARSTVHAALYLVWTFIQAAMIWLLLRAEFLAMALVAWSRHLRVHRIADSARVQLTLRPHRSH